MKPRVIGVTGGVGSGKSECLRYIEKLYDCIVIYADPEAAKLRKKGEVCYAPLLELLGSDVLDGDGEIDSRKMAEKVFADEKLLKKVNLIIHPAVNERIRGIIKNERDSRARDFVFIEAALLIENGYEEIVDEMWYIYADEDIRRRRLAESRGYSDSRICDVMSGQLSDEEFRAHCDRVIDNGGDFLETRKQIDRILGEYIGGTKRSAN